MMMKPKDIINQAYYLIGEYPPQSAPPDYYLSEGLTQLNLMLASFSANGILIPYREVVTFPMVVGKSVYTFSSDVSADVASNKIADLLDVNLIRNNVTYIVNIISSEQYYESYRYNQTQTIPLNVFLQNSPSESTLTFYPVPDFAYQCQVVAKYVLSDLSLTTNISNLPSFYYQFMIFGLAKQLSFVFETGNWTADKENQYQDLKRNVENSTDTDMDLRFDLSGRLSGAAAVKYGI